MRRLDEEEEHLKEWLEKEYHGKMAYMQNHFEKRLNPGLLVPDALSVISFLYNYYPGVSQNKDSYKVAKYAYGEDYHTVIKDNLYNLVKEIELLTGSFSFRVFVDSAPVMERQWAALSGLGWIGKNSLLLRQGTGSFFFIASIICSLNLTPDNPVTDHCGTCTACIDACPTDAIVADGVIDASKCISYHTIELKSDIPENFKGKSKDWIFGCDICQDVCPWNKFSISNTESRFQPETGWPEWDKQDWDNMSEEIFEKTFKKSALQRAGYSKLKRNIEFQNE